MWSFTFKRITSWADFVTNMKSTNRVLLSLEVALIFHNHVVRAKKKKLFCEWSFSPVITVLQDLASLIHLHHMCVSISFFYSLSPCFIMQKSVEAIMAMFQLISTSISLNVLLFFNEGSTQKMLTDWETCYFILGNIIANALWCQRDTYTEFEWHFNFKSSVSQLWDERRRCRWTWVQPTSMSRRFSVHSIPGPYSILRPLQLSASLLKYQPELETLSAPAVMERIVH